VTGSERWSALEIRLLVAFVAVVDTGSFTAAAKRLGYTQSGISQQVAALERIVGRKLLVRQAGGRRPSELTSSGETLLRHSRTILVQLDRAFDDLVAGEGARTATVRVASFSSASVHLLPALHHALRTNPLLRATLLEGVGDEQLFGWLDTREAELGFAVLPVPARFAFDELGLDPYVAVVPSGSRLAQGRELAVEQLIGRPLLGIRRCPHEAAVEARLAAAGIDCRMFSRYDDNRLIQALAAAGDGIAVVPSLTVDTADESVRALPIRGDVPARTIALVRLRDGLLSPAARDFRQFALPICRRLLETPSFDWAHARAS
jgi:molybdate transport repressor ModE-like protein